MNITLSVVVLFISMLTPGIESRDEEGTESQCSSNFNELVKQITASDKNRYNLQRAFFPPERESAIFVAITYSYENAPDNISVWYWSVSTYYIYFPSKVLPWISLLFIEPSSRHSAINITLSEECLGADDDMMQLLTQRLQLLAERNSLYPITSNYESRAESAETLTTFFNEHKVAFSTVMAVQVFMFITANLSAYAFLLCLLKCHPFLLGNRINATMNQDRYSYNKLKDTDDEDGRYNDWDIQALLHFIVIISVFIWLYVITADAFGIHNLRIREKSAALDRDHRINLLYSLPAVILTEDVLVLFVSIITSLCFVVPGKLSRREGEFLWLIIPIVLVTNHFTHIVIGFIVNPLHATSVGLYYCFYLLASTLLFKLIASAFFKKEKSSECCFFSCCVCLQIFLTGVFMLVALIYFYLPINKAIDVAPTKLSGFISSAVLVFAGYTAYHLLRSHKMNKNCPKNSDADSKLKSLNG